MNVQINQRELKQAFERENLVVVKRFGEDRRVNQTTDLEEIYFALLAQDMMQLAAKYKRDIDEIHKIFFEVSCDREKLIKILEGKNVDKWSLLEDLALEGDPNAEGYRYVRSQKGEVAVEQRKYFLEINNQ